MFLLMSNQNTFIEIINSENYIISLDPLAYKYISPIWDYTLGTVHAGRTCRGISNFPQNHKSPHIYQHPRWGRDIHFFDKIFMKFSYFNLLIFKYYLRYCTFIRKGNKISCIHAVNDSFKLDLSCMPKQWILQLGLTWKGWANWHYLLNPYHIVDFMAQPYNVYNKDINFPKMLV